MDKNICIKFEGSCCERTYTVFLSAWLTSVEFYIFPFLLSSGRATMTTFLYMVIGYIILCGLVDSWIIHSYNWYSGLAHYPVPDFLVLLFESMCKVWKSLWPYYDFQDFYVWCELHKGDAIIVVFFFAPTSLSLPLSLSKLDFMSFVVRPPKKIYCTQFSLRHYCQWTNLYGKMNFLTP